MDELSGLYNRRYLNAVLSERKFTKCKSLYGIMMDVNAFKYINDNFGHSMGYRKQIVYLVATPPQAPVE